MSQLRNRQRGAQTSTQLETKEDARPAPSLYMGGTKHWKNDEIEDIIRGSVIPRKKYVMTSISDKAMRVKTALEEDPYNLDLIVELGYIYASEVQFDKAANVLVRGWKRAGELKEPGDRFKFLLKLAEVSFRNRQYRQAHAVLQDIDEPEDYYEKKAYQLLNCHAHAEIGDGSKALAIFSKAIDGEEFGQAVKIWAASAIRLKKVGTHQAAKEAVSNKAREGNNGLMDQSRIQTVESWTMMGDRSNDPVGSLKEQFTALFDLEDGIPKWMIGAAIGFLVLLFVLFLHWMEKNNLRNMKMIE